MFAPARIGRYHNNETFVGETGQTLSAEVRRARALGIEIVLAHENDPARGGCPFNRLFQSTPHELVTEVTQALSLGWPYARRADPFVVILCPDTTVTGLVQQDCSGTSSWPPSYRGSRALGQSVGRSEEGHEGPSVY